MIASRRVDLKHDIIFTHAVLVITSPRRPYTTIARSEDAGLVGFTAQALEPEV